VSHATPLKLATLFFINAAAMGMWSVPFGNVLKAHGYEDIIGYAYACSGVAAFISPLAVGALADQHIPPARLVRWLAVMTSMCLTLVFTAIGRHWSPLVVLACVQLQAICAAPTFGLSTTIVLSSLKNPGREFGPIRSTATVGWMAAGWFVSFVLNADTSIVCGYAAGGDVALHGGVYLRTSGDSANRAEGTARYFRPRCTATLCQQGSPGRVSRCGIVQHPMAAFYPFTPIHLTELGVNHATAAMTLGQVSEVISMFGLAGLLTRWRLKWVFLVGIGFGVLRFALCAMNSRGWLLTGISMHGFAFTLFFHHRADLPRATRRPAHSRPRPSPSWRS
jgi:MFS family permease